MKNHHRILKLLGVLALSMPFLQAYPNTERYFAELTKSKMSDVGIPGGGNAPGAQGLVVNRYGEDGSAAFLDDSGVIVWKLSDGVYKALPNTGKAKPLFVTGRECIVWRNAYESSAELRAECDITYFRIDANSGAIIETSNKIVGNTVAETPVITLINRAHIIAVAMVRTQPGATEDSPPLQIYRLPYAADNVQALSKYSPYSETDVGSFYSINTVSASSDGSIIMQLNDQTINGDGNMDTQFVWVTPDGKVSPLLSPGDGFVVEQLARAQNESQISAFGTSNEFSSTSVFGVVRINMRVVRLTATTVQFGAENYSSFIYVYKRPLNTDAAPREETPGIDLRLVAPADANRRGRIVGLPTNGAALPGQAPIFLLQREDVLETLELYRIGGDYPELRFDATLPKPLFGELSLVKADVSSGAESIAINDPNNEGIVWLHSGAGIDYVNGSVPSTDFSLLDEEIGVPMYVTENEMIVWSNSDEVSYPDAGRPALEVTHYGRDGLGGIASNTVTVTKDATNPSLLFGSPLSGRFILPTNPYTTDPFLWRIETFENVGADLARFRAYQLRSDNETDRDQDGILTGYEEAPFYVIPGTFTYDEAVADATRRGGRLATFADAAEFAAMQVALDLWARDEFVAYPFRQVPYPLWIGLENNGSWAWADGSANTIIATGWDAGEPSVVVGRTRGQLTSNQLWKAVNPSTRSGYLLELTVTDPEALDTDADGANDYDESFRLITDPVVAGFGLGAGPGVVNFADPTINGNYEGYITDTTHGPIAALNLKLTANGGFSGKLVYSDSVGTLRGIFSSTGTANNIVVSSRGALTRNSILDLKIVQDGVSGKYRIQGRVTNGIAFDETYRVLELRRSAYSAMVNTADAGAYTIALPPEKQPTQGSPVGYGLLTGSVGSDGRCKLAGFTSDGQPIKWAGNLLEGDFMSFFSSTGVKSRGLAAGNLFFRKFAEVDALMGLVKQSDLDGDALVSRVAGSATGGYAFHSKARGSRYYQASFFQLPAFRKIPVLPGNVELHFEDGSFAADPLVATWSSMNTITTPPTQTHALSAKINSRNGQITGKYTYRNPDLGFAATVAKLNGVTLQKSGELLCQYVIGGGRSGPLVITPNYDNSPLLANTLSPVSKSVGAGGDMYQVYISTNEPWTAAVHSQSGTYMYTGNPENWISIYPTAGTGSGTVTIRVAANGSVYEREGKVMIAGVAHRVKQERPTVTQDYSDQPIIIPTIREGIPAAGENYLVQVYNYEEPVNKETGEPIPNFDNYSPVDWATVTYVQGQTDTKTKQKRGVAEVKIAANSSASSRTVTLVIGGVFHKVTQLGKTTIGQ